MEVNHQVATYQWRSHRRPANETPKTASELRPLWSRWWNLVPVSNFFMPQSATNKSARNMKFCISPKTTWRSWCIHWYRLNTANSKKPFLPALFLSPFLKYLVIYGSRKISPQWWHDARHLPKDSFRCHVVQAQFLSIMEPMGVDFTVIKHRETMVKVAWWKYGFK